MLVVSVPVMRSMGTGARHTAGESRKRPYREIVAKSFFLI